jgi:hypothetical protein
MSFNYAVQLNDPTNAGGSADPILVYDLQQALGVWSQYISGIGTLVVALDIANTTQGRESGGPTSSSFIGTNSQGLNILEASSLYELTTGQHVSGTTSDITITIDPGYFHNLDLAANLTYNSQVPNNEYNPIIVFLHELTHGFGMTGWYSQTGSLPSNYESPFDAFIQKTSAGAFFTGPNAEAAYGGPVPLTTNSSVGQNYYHFGNDQSDLFRTPSTIQDPLTLDLMNGIVLFYNYKYAISNLDLGVLQDLGYNVAATTTAALPPLQGLTTPEQQTEAMYVAYFGRAGDAGGTHFWMGNLEMGQTIDDVAMNYSKQLESENLYPFLQSPTTDNDSFRVSFIDSIYQNLFNRGPDAGGLNYWDGELHHDQQTLSGDALARAIGGFILEVIRGAQNGAAGQDITAIQNKVAVASSFTDQLSLHNVSYANNQPLAIDNQAHSVVANTDSTSTSVTTQKSAIDVDVVIDLTNHSGAALVGITTVHDFQAI